MHARAIDDASRRLHELHTEERDDLVAAALGMGLSLAATQLYPPLALPLFLGGVTLAARGCRAIWRHWEMVDRLTRDRDAYAIPEIFARASREATLERRQAFAAVLRTWLRTPWPDLEPRVTAARDEIEALIAELEDEHLRLDVEAAVVCRRLLSESAESPLLNAALPPEDLLTHIRHIRSGFTSADAA
jgi:hypothetical protein